MKKKTIFLFFGLTLIANQTFGQTFKEQFHDLFFQKDTSEQQKQLLEKWEKANSNDPELYVAYFNYYVHESKKEAIRIDNNPKGNNVFQLTDPADSDNNPVGYMNFEIIYDQKMLQNGFAYIDKGIKKYPDRLDMRFGKIYILGQIEDYEKFTSEIIKVVNYSSINKNKWTWSDSKPLDDSQKFMLNAVQGYQNVLYDTRDVNSLDNIKRISETVLQYYPDHVESLSNLSVVYMNQKKYDEALKLVLKAEKINPQDYIVLMNIAQAYKLKGDFDNSIKYYKLAIKYGDEDAKKYAQEQIDKLQKK